MSNFYSFDNAPVAPRYEIPPIDVNERVDKDYETLVKPWKLPSPARLCLVNGNLVDTVSGTVIKEVNIFLNEGKIVHITKCTSKHMVNENFKKIDCTGKYITPGMMDNHVHITSVQGETGLERLMNLPKSTMMMRVPTCVKNILFRGFTAVRDCGGAEHFIRDAIDDGVFPGPRLFIAGNLLSQTGGHGDMRPSDVPGEANSSVETGHCNCHSVAIGKVCDGVTECLKASRENMRRGANFIKIMGSGGVLSPSDKITNIQFTEEEVQLIVKVAKSYGTYVTLHCYTPELIKHCILNGVKGIEHGNLLDDESAALMSKLGCFFTPTLITYKIMASDQFSQFMPPSGLAKNLQVLNQGLQSLLIARDHGVTICHGSDLLGSLQGYQTQEFFMRSKVLSAAEILKSATVNFAKCNNVLDMFGQVKVGYMADLLVMNGNPLEDITILDEPETNLLIIMKGGLIYKNQIDGYLDV